MSRLALDTDVAAVATHGVVHDGQAQAGALRAAVELSVDAVDEEAA